MALEAVGSNPTTHPTRVCQRWQTLIFNIGLSPSGKAQDFDSCIRAFKSRQPSHAPVLTRGGFIYLPPHLTSVSLGEAIGNIE